MSLTIVAKNIIGDLRAVNTVLLILISDSVEFPMDATFQKLITNNNSVFQEIIDKVCEICQMESVYDELKSSVDEIIIPSTQEYYTEETVTLLLNLYLHNADIKIFNYQDISVFHKEMKFVLDATIIDLFDSILAGRIAYYNTYPYIESSNLKSLILQLLTLIYSLESEYITSPEILLPSLFENWVKLREYRATNGSPQDVNRGYERVIQELR